jgi:hypothetical protein
MFSAISRFFQRLLKRTPKTLADPPFVVRRDSLSGQMVMGRIIELRCRLDRLTAEMNRLERQLERAQGPVRKVPLIKKQIEITKEQLAIALQMETLQATLV